jgi:glutamate formiminotransferase/formiminotetrahydrofolate cyclodeaminase
MDRSLLSKTVADFADEVSRETPAPGGGSVAALAGALGAALASMVANLAKGKTGSEPKDELLTAMAVRARQIKNALLAAVDEDTQAFEAYLDALRLPKSTPEEKALRGERIQAGLRDAVRVPLRTAELSLEVMRLAQTALAYGNPNSMTDAAVGAQMAFAGVQGGVWNVRINLKTIKDAAFRAEMDSRCSELVAGAGLLLGELGAEVDRRLQE